MSFEGPVGILLSPLITKENDEPKCPNCQKRYSEISPAAKNLQRHLKSCGKTASFQCPTCGICIKRKDNLKVHQITCSGPTLPSSPDSAVFKTPVLTERKATHRAKRPTSDDLNPEAIKRRVTETISAAKELHGGSTNSDKETNENGESVRPETLGLWLSFTRHATRTEIDELVSTCPVIQQSAQKIQKEEKKMESKTDKMVELSLATLYNYGRGEPTSKKNYKNMRKITKQTGGSVLTSYDDLMMEIKTRTALNSRLRNINELIPLYLESGGDLLQLCNISVEKAQKPGANVSNTNMAKRMMVEAGRKKRPTPQMVPPPETETIEGQEVAAQYADQIRGFLNSIEGGFFDFEQFAVRLCQLYASVNKKLTDSGRPSILQWFDDPEKPKTFYLTLGVDGTPLQMNITRTATLFTVGLVNTLHLTQVPQHNHILCYSNINEDSKLLTFFVEKFIRPVAEEMESKFFEIEPYGLCQIKPGLIKVDQKAANKLTGESTQTATYFTGLAKISSGTMTGNPFGCSFKDVGGTWSLEERNKLADELQKFKIKLDKMKYATSTQRTKIGEFLQQNRSRQLIRPPIGKYFSLIHPDPLHCANLTVQHEWIAILKTLISVSQPGLTSFVQLSNSNLLKAFLLSLSRQFNGLEARQLFNWSMAYCDKEKSETANFRFQGKTSKLVMKNLGLFFYQCKELIKTDADLAKIMIHIYIMRQQRIIYSLAFRMHISEKQIEELSEACQLYYAALALFGKLYCTAYIVGQLFVEHARQIKEYFGLGLGICSTQGQEHKNSFLHSYANHTNHHKNAYVQIIRHDEVHCRLLFGSLDAKTLSKEWAWGKDKKVTLLIEENQVGFCLCGAPTQAGRCYFCDNELFGKIDKAARNQTMDNELMRLLNIKH